MKNKFSGLKIPLIIISLITGLIVSLRETGFLEFWELNTADQMIRWRKPEKKDPRILVVEITAEDVQIQKQWPLSDAIIHQLLRKLNENKPIAIGLDIYRDLPVNPGHEEFSKYLQKTNNIIPICKANDSKTRGVSPPLNILDERVGFADIVVDSGGIVRRGLLFMDSLDNSLCKTPFSLSFQLARRYLETLNIKPTLNSNQELQIGKAVFPKLNKNSANYHNLDYQGYQILLNYRSKTNITDTVTLEDVLQNRIKPSQIKDKIILIGVTDPAIDDAFYTPYSAAAKTEQKMAGVNIHAQLISLLINVALEERKLISYWPQIGENIWIIFWCLLGGIIPYNIKKPLLLLSIEISLFLLLLTSSWLFFLQSVLIPVIPPLLGLIGSSGLIFIFQGYSQQKKAEEMSFLVSQQNEVLLELQQLLQQQKNSSLNQIDRQNELETKLELDIETALNTELETTLELDIETRLNTELETEIPPEITEETNIFIEKYQQKTVQSELLNGRYQVSRTLGQGGFGSIYLAEDTFSSNTQCVIKRLQPAMQDQYFLGVARRLFKTEVEILKQLGNHPQIPKLWTYFEENGEFYLVEEYIPGNLLSEEIKNNKPLKEENVIQIIKEILLILKYIHAKGVIHRDLKPSNIIRSSINNKLVLIDFGAVKQINPHLEEVEKTVSIGTKGYTPPEQLLGQPNFSSDIYALGMIAIEALTAIDPHHLKVNSKTGNVLWQNLTNVHPSFARIIDKMVAYNFPQRYQSAINVLKDLESL